MPLPTKESLLVAYAYIHSMMEPHAELNQHGEVVALQSQSRTKASSPGQKEEEKPTWAQLKAAIVQVHLDNNDEKWFDKCWSGQQTKNGYNVQRTKNGYTKEKFIGCLKKCNGSRARDLWALPTKIFDKATKDAKKAAFTDNQKRIFGLDKPKAKASLDSKKMINVYVPSKVADKIMKKKDREAKDKTKQSQPLKKRDG